MIYERDRIEFVSEALSELRYSEMQELGRRLYDIACDREEFFGDHTKLSAASFADLLADWAEQTERGIDEEEIAS